MQHLSSHRICIHKIWYLSIFRNSVQKVQISLKSKNNGTLHEDICLGTFITISRWILLRMRNVSDENCKENQNTFMLNNFFFRKSCRLWDNVENCGTARQPHDSIIWSMRFTCWVTKNTCTHSECKILTDFPRKQWLRERASMLRLYVDCLSCSHYNTIGIIQHRSTISLGVFNK
jgi:hypothetical protein